MPLSDYLSKPSLDMLRQQPSIENPSLGMYQQKPDVLHPTLNMTQEDMARPVTYPSQETQPQQAKQTPTDIYGWLKQADPKMDLSADIDRAERERKRHLFGNVATVLGQGLGSLMGARQFTPVQNNDAYYQQRIDQLRNLQRGYDADWARQKFQAELGQLQREEARRYNEGQDALKHDRQKELLGIKNDNTMGQIGARNAAALEQIGARGKEQQAQIKMRNDGSYRVQVLRNAGKVRTGSGSSNGNTQLVDMVEYTLPKGFLNDKGKIADLWRYVPDEIKARTGKVTGQRYDYLTREMVDVRSTPTQQEMVNAIMEAAPHSDAIQQAFEKYNMSQQPTATQGSRQTSGWSLSGGSGKSEQNGWSLVN